jgi:hypothetical protein
MAKHRLGEILKKRKLSKLAFSRLIEKKYENTLRYYKDSFDPKLSTLTEWARALRVKVRDLIKEK